MPEQDTVGHVMRSFLAKTETFIGNQIGTLQNYRPVVFCHHRVPNVSFSLPDVYAVEEQLPPFPRLIDRVCYRAGRYLPGLSTDVLVKKIHEESVRLLHLHYLVDARFFLALKRRTGLPAIVSVYGYDVSSFPRLLGGYGRRYLLSLFQQMDYFLAMSSDMKYDLIRLGCPAEKIIVHYYGTDTQRFQYPERSFLNKDPVNVLVCGTLEIKKAQHLVLQALWLAEQRHLLHRCFRVTLVGDGPMKAQLLRQVKEYGWQDRVTFKGHIPYHTKELIDAYRQADIFSLPSITVDGDKEGIPGTIVEAMACGLPVVSTYHAGISEIIVSGQEGILVPEKNVEATARAFADLINDVSLREKLGRAAAERATGELDLQQGTARLERIYAQVVGS